MSFKKNIRKVFNYLGIDVLPANQSTVIKLLGLTNERFGLIIDVGANKGQFACGMLKKFPEAKFVCFEPLEQPFARLFDWSSKQRKRVICHQLALGHVAGEVEMYRHEAHDESSSILKASPNCHSLFPQTTLSVPVSIKISTLDSFLSEFKVLAESKDVLLKLDVQGFEDRVLRGGINTLKICNAIIMEISLELLYEGQASFLELVNFLDQNGFHYAGNLNQVLGSRGQVIFLDALFRRSTEL